MNNNVGMIKNIMNKLNNATFERGEDILKEYDFFESQSAKSEGNDCDVLYDTDFKRFFDENEEIEVTITYTSEWYLNNCDECNCQYFSDNECVDGGKSNFQDCPAWELKEAYWHVCGMLDGVDLQDIEECKVSAKK